MDILQFVSTMSFNEVQERLKRYIFDQNMQKWLLKFSGLFYVMLICLLYYLRLYVHNYVRAAKGLASQRIDLHTGFLGGTMPDALVELLIYVAVYLMALFLSKGLVRLFTRANFRYWEKSINAYEKHDNRFYLKEECVWLREYIGRFDKKLWGIAASFFIFFSVYDVTEGDQKFQDIVWLIGHFGIWLHLQGKYFSGRTYSEEKAFLERPRDKMGGLALLNNLSGKTMHNSIKQLLIMKFPLQYGIRYPENSFSEDYKSFYMALKMKENIYVEDIFFHDWGRAFFIPVHEMLLQLKKVVVLAGPSLDVQDIYLWIKKELHKLLTIKESWKTCIWNESESQSDIYIVPFEEIPHYIHRCETLHKEDMGIFCVVMEPSAMLLQIQMYLEQYVNYLNKMILQPVYCFVDRNEGGIIDYLSHVFLCKIRKIEINLERCQQIYLCTSETVENEEVKNYWGIINSEGGGCASVYFNELLKNSVSGVELASAELFPVRDFFMRNKQRISTTFSSQIDVTTHARAFNTARHYKGIWGISKEDVKYLLVTDDQCNWYELFWLLSTRGNRESYIFLMSGGYLLFDFMVKKAPELLRIRDAVPVFFPVYQDTVRNRLLKLFRHFAVCHTFSRKDVDKLFPDLAGKSNAVAIEYLNGYAKRLFHERPFALGQQDIRIGSRFMMKNLALWEEVYIVEEDTNKRQFGCLLACHMDQIWSEGQYIIWDGGSYLIRKISDGSVIGWDGNFKKVKEVTLLRNSTVLQQRRSVYQYRRFFLNRIRIEKVDNIDTLFIIYLCYADICVHANGWYLEKIDDEGSRKVKSVKGPVRVREYWNKQVLFISWKKFNSGKQEQKFWIDLCEILSRIARTIYPRHYPYLAFKPATLPVNVGNEASGTGMYVIEDCVDDQGLLESFQKNWIRILELCMELCSYLGKEL